MANVKFVGRGNKVFIVYDSKGVEVPVLEESISPLSFEGEPKIALAIVLMIIGFLTILVLEKIGSKNRK